MDNATTYSCSRPFPSRFASECAFSGVRFGAGTPVRAICDGFNEETRENINVRFVADRFVSAACDPNWIRVSGSPLDVIADGVTFWTLDKHANQSKAWTRNGASFCVEGGTSISAAAFASRVWKHAIAFKVWVRI